MQKEGKVIDKPRTDPEEAGAAGETALLQYWSSSRSVDAPDHWPEPFEFPTVDDAVTFAMTQTPSDQEVAWLKTPDGRTLRPDQIRRLWAMRRM